MKILYIVVVLGLFASGYNAGPSQGVYPIPADQSENYPDQMEDMTAEEHFSKFQAISNFFHSLFNSFMTPFGGLFGGPTRSSSSDHDEFFNDLKTKKINESSGQVDGNQFSQSVHHIVNHEGEVVGHIEHTSFTSDVGSFYDDEEDAGSSAPSSSDIDQAPIVTEKLEYPDLENEDYYSCPGCKDVSLDSTGLESEYDDSVAIPDDDDQTDQGTDLRDLFRNAENYERPSFKEAPAQGQEEAVVTNYKRPSFKGDRRINV